MESKPDKLTLVQTVVLLENIGRNAKCDRHWCEKEIKKNRIETRIKTRIETRIET